MEKIVTEQGQDVSRMPQVELDAIWDVVKQNTK
jgi:hypothetical protein